MTKKYDNLQHLSEEELDKLMERYYAFESVDSLLKEYQLNIRANALYKEFPEVINTEKICEYCDGHMKMIQPSRTVKASPYYEEDWFCLNCEHHAIKKCRCDKCKMRRAEEKKQIEFEILKKEKEEEERLKREEQERIEKIKSEIRVIWKESIDNPVDIKDLGDFEKINLGVLIHGYISEDLSKLEPFCNKRFLISPYEKLDEIIIGNLIRAKIIYPMDTMIESFDNNDYSSFCYSDIEYHINISNQERNLILTKYGMGKILITNVILCYNLWVTIAASECLEFLVTTMNEAGFEFNPKQKTEWLMREMLNHYSASQICRIIDKCVASGLKDYIKYRTLLEEKTIQEDDYIKTSRRFQANCIIAGIERFYNKAIKEGWVLSNYYRSKNYIQSAYSSFLFDCILHIGHRGFLEKPDIHVVADALGQEVPKSNNQEYLESNDQERYEPKVIVKNGEGIEINDALNTDNDLEEDID